jgi:hypothetical protein
VVVIFLTSRVDGSTVKGLFPGTIFSNAHDQTSFFHSEKQSRIQQSKSLFFALALCKYFFKLILLFKMWWRNKLKRVYFWNNRQIS